MNFNANWYTPIGVLNRISFDFSLFIFDLIHF
nr:MAG TPA: hypothetical protein [Caudoviricetes sp.]